MKSWTVILLQFGLLLAATPGFGIGRSGNGSGLVSESLGFESGAPKAFPEIRQLEGNAIRLRYPGVEYLNGAMIQPFIEISPIAKFFPELGSLLRGQIEQHFNNLGWIKASARSSCIDLYQQPNSEVFVALWGKGKGISLIGPDSTNVKAGIEEILSTLQLKAGACGW
jgi:hypothetical protein